MMSETGNNTNDLSRYPEEELPKPATHLERFRSYQTRLNWAFVTVLPVLFTVWLGSLESRSVSLHELRTNYLNVLEIRTEKSEFDREYDRRLKRAETGGLDLSTTTRRKDVASKQDYEDRYKRAKGKFLESKSGFVDFDLLQFKLPISTSLAPAVWSLVLLGFFGYALVQRRRAYAEILAYVETCRRRYDCKLLVPGVAGDSGFTLAPVPRLPPSASISDTEVATILAWGGDGVRQRALLLAALFAVIAIIQLRVLLLALEFNSTLIQVTRVYPLPARLLAIVASFACASGTAFLAYRWWRAPISPAAPHEVQQAAGGPLIGRRHALGIVLPAFAVAAALFGDWLNNRHLRRLGIDPGSNAVRSLAGHAPRWRRREKPVPVEVGLPNGLALDPSIRTLTYVDDEGRLRKKEGNLAVQPVHQTLAQAIAWVDKAAPTRWSTWRLEENALDLVERGKFEDACRLLLAGVRLNLRRSLEELNCGADMPQPPMSDAPRTAALAVPRGFFSPDEVPRASVPVPQIGGALDAADAALVDALQELAAQLGRNAEAFEKLSQQMEGSDHEVDTGELDTPANRRQAKRRDRTTQRKQPDLRTFDLLAGLAVRYGLERYLDEMIEAIQASPQHCKACLTDRVEKWRMDEGSWRRRWADRTHFIKWHRPVMFGRGQRARVRFAQLPTPK